MPRLTGPDKVADPRSPMLDSHTCNRGSFLLKRKLFTQTELFTFLSKEREKPDKKCCVGKEGLLVHWVGGLVSGYQLISISGAHNTKTTVDDKPAKVLRDLLWPREVKITLKR